MNLGSQQNRSGVGSQNGLSTIGSAARMDTLIDEKILTDTIVKLIIKTAASLRLYFRVLVRRCFDLSDSV